MFAIVCADVAGMPAVAAYAYHVAYKLGFEAKAFVVPVMQTDTTDFLDGLIKEHGITLALVFTDWWLQKGLEFCDVVYTYRHGEAFLDHKGDLVRGTLLQAVKAFLPEDRPSRSISTPEPVIEYLEGIMCGKKSKYHAIIQSGLRSIEDLEAGWDSLRAPYYQQAMRTGGRTFEKHLALFDGKIGLTRVLMHGEIIQRNQHLTITKRVALRSGSGLLRGHAYALLCNSGLDSVAMTHEELHRQHPAAPLTIVMVPWPTISKTHYYIKSWDEAIDVSTLSLGLEPSPAGVYWEVASPLPVPDVSERCPVEAPSEPEATTEQATTIDTATTIEDIRATVNGLADQLQTLSRDLNKPSVHTARQIGQHINDALREQEAMITSKPARICVIQ